MTEALAAWLQAVMPEWVGLPDLSFELPHAAYWIGLIAFPLIALALLRRERDRAPPTVSAAIAYLMLLSGGFVGLHRFYVRASLGGLVYIALFLLVLHGNQGVGAARNFVSDAANQSRIAEFDVARFQVQLERGRDGAEERLQDARTKLIRLRTELAMAVNRLDRWGAFAGTFLLLIGLGLVLDAILLPRMVARARARESGAPIVTAAPAVAARRSGPIAIHTPFTRVVDALSGASGTFVAYWSIIAVFVYYYEVMARYVFNAPTNWAHESMFLMFGMQYLLSGAYALREGAHVRVDVIYERLSVRTRTRIDVVTSVLFFVFTLTLLATGSLFAADSLSVLEVSFTEWAIQYWPVKLMLALGALLLVLQGAAHLVRDVTYLRRSAAAAGG